MSESSLLSDMTRKTIHAIYKECKRDENKKKLTSTFGLLSNIMMEYMRPYLYSIMLALIAMFVMNCFQFYYYMKYVAVVHPHIDLFTNAN
jgi:hypothetical protein